MSARDLLSMAARLGCVGVEFRNDLARPLFDGEAPATIGAAAQSAGQKILALAEVKAFNDFTEQTRTAAEALMQAAVACGAATIALIPRNDGRRLGESERRADLAFALNELAPMLERHGLIGLIEPLGFETCNLRHKGEVVEVIESLGQADRFRLVHDTFHHHLAGGGPVFAAQTGIVHISGLADPAPSVTQMRDGHRGLVDAHDRLDNLGQIAALRAAGYHGPLSFEPFAPEFHALPDPEAALARSIAFIRAGLGDAAA
ncbi:TIM barrel protein [Oceaniglobus trochenteri]|uniref:TIM barrel protein n=1 Tax=Oceaniglobus trochenteri TaxID=2763260 RepID=UPI001CFFD138|nr:TIM barrel protein [Oceaniglobus trochenteri]